MGFSWFVENLHGPARTKPAWLRADAAGEGFETRSQAAALERQVQMKSGSIRSSLFAATDDAGVPDNVASQLADIFGSDVDFHRDLRRGDHFTVIYELYTLEGRAIRSGRVLAAESGKLDIEFIDFTLDQLAAFTAGKIRVQDVEDLLGASDWEDTAALFDALAANGLQFTNFHVTPLCSPTRAALLTGRAPHAAGMRSVSNFRTGFPHMLGHVSTQTATVAEVLRDHGYATFMVGKWHLAPMEECSAAGPFDQWPLGRGFDRFYGFMDGETDQFHPDLVRDNHHIAPPGGPEDGYHLSEDLADQVDRASHDDA